MHIIYAASTCSDETYRKLFEAVKNKPAFQSQKYHRLLIEGLASHTSVDVAASLPVNREVLHQSVRKLPQEDAGGARYHYATAYRDSFRKYLFGGLEIYRTVSKLLRPDSVVIVDCLNCTTAFFAQLAARHKGCRCVGIITDLPDMLGYNKFYRGLSNRVIAGCTDYVLLTEAMNSRINPGGKPHVILEGHADISMADKPPLPKRSPRTCLYAGSVRKIYGLDRLVEGFLLADLPDTQLLIYGPGDYVPELQAIAAKDSRVVYGGMLLSSQVVDEERKAALLVNPRPTDEEYVRYSFPSKTMEYMASGTPVLTTDLPGMPREYLPYLNLIREETPQGIADALKAVFAQSEEALNAQGQRARAFVLEQRNNCVQAKKILTMLESTGRM